MVQLKGQYQLSDFKAAQKLHAYRGWLTSCLGYLAAGFWVVVALNGFIYAMHGAASWPVVVIVPGIAVGGWALFIRVLVPRRVARVFAQRKELAAPFEVEFDAAGQYFQNEYGNSRIPWDHFTKWKQNEEVLLLYRSDALFTMLPKRLFQNQGDADYVLDRLREKGVTQAQQAGSLLEIASIAAFIVLAVCVTVGLWTMQFWAK